MTDPAARARLLSARYQHWGLGLGDSWQSPYSGRILAEEDALAELDRCEADGTRNPVKAACGEEP